MWFLWVYYGSIQSYTVEQSRVRKLSSGSCKNKKAIVFPIKPIFSFEKKNLFIIIRKIKLINDKTHAYA